MAASQAISIVKSMGKLFKLLSLDKKDISAIYIFAILMGLVQLSLPLGIQTIISFVMAGSISTSIVVLIVLVVLGTFISGLLQVRQMQVIERVEQKIFVRYSLQFSDTLPKLNLEKLDNYYLPELVNRFFDTVSLQKGLEKILLDVPAAIIQILLGIILLSFYHTIFIAFGAFLLLIIFLIIRFTSLKGLETSLEASDYKYKIAAWLQEMARVIKSFKYSKGVELHNAKTTQLVDGYLNARTNHFKTLLTQYWSLTSFKIIITAVMLIVGSALLVDQEINIGQFIAADIVILSIIGSVEKLVGNLDKVYDALTSIEKLSKITEADVETSGSLTLSNANKGVSIGFNNVTFTYPNGEQVLHNTSFSVKPGQIVHVTGLSGAGKSTLLRLLTGTYSQFEGTILIDDVPLKNYNLASLREQTGIFLNQQDIFHGSLLENLTLGNPEITLQEVTFLTEKTGLNQFIQSQPNGFDTQLDPQGKRLSKSVRQNILLLRALLGKHRLLLLEEPFTHLSEAQKNAMLHFIKTDKNATIVITSADTAISSECDVVVAL